MARWRLTAPHYLYVTYHPFYEDIQWEYTEQDRISGRMLRKRFKVPFELNTKDENNQNYPGQGYIVSNKQSPEYPRDIVFEGEPTLDMIPLDAEAERLSQHYVDNHPHPIEGLPSQGEFGQFSSALLSYLEKQLDEASQGRKTQPVSLKGADQAILDRLAALEKANADLTARLAGEAAPEEFEPLPPANESELPLNPPPPVRPAASRPSRRI